jgi:hypothetical protein
MEINKFIYFIQQLIKKTENKQAIWNKTSSSEQFKLILDKGTIIIDKNYDRDDGSEYFQLSLINEDGYTIENIAGYPVVNDYYFDSLHNLYFTVNGIFYKVDETIDEFLKELDSDKEIGREKDSKEDVDTPF